jgi:hypothetical protein
MASMRVNLVVVVPSALDDCQPLLSSHRLKLTVQVRATKIGVLSACQDTDYASRCKLFWTTVASSSPLEPPGALIKDD